jgi:hypothetical protein
MESIMVAVLPNRGLEVSLYSPGLFLNSLGLFLNSLRFSRSQKMLKMLKKSDKQSKYTP